MARVAEPSTTLPALVFASDDVESRHEDPHIHTDASATPSSRVATPSTSSSRVKSAASPVKLPAAQGSSSAKPTKANDKTNRSALPPTSLVPRSNNNNPKPFHCKLNVLQISSLLKPFWNDLLQNQLKSVRRILQENHLRTIDFDSTLVRYAPNADGTPVHLCAQFGFLAMAKMLVADFQLSATHRNKVGSTPLHVACKSGHAAFVSWLLDELHVPLDVPDNQHRIALDVAPYDIVDKCVLGPLRDQYALLKHREEELVAQNGSATEELLSAELAFRRSAMALSDTEAHVDEARARIEALSVVDRHWHEQLQAKREVLKACEAQYDSLKEVLEREQASAQELFEKEVRSVQEDNVAARQELEQWQALVDTTQRELDRRSQLLVDQLGVFDAALVEFPGSRDVQEWVLATLLAITGSTEGEKELLLLRPEPVEVVRHVLSAFPSDYVLQSEAVGLLVAIQRIHATTDAEIETIPLFVKAVVDSDLLLLLGECLSRWFEADQVKTVASEPRLSELLLEAVYWCLRLPRNAQRALAFCQRKHLHTVPLRALEICEASAVRRHVSLVLLTQIQFGVKKPLLTNGIVRVVYEWLSGAVAEDEAFLSVEDHAATMETAQNLFACLALLTSSPLARKREESTHVEPRSLEDLTPDSQSITAHAMLKFLSHHVKHADEAVGVVMWASRLLKNLVSHGGATAHRLRQELLGQDGFGCFSVVADSLQLVVAAEGDALTQAVQATLDLVQAVWVERFDIEGQLLPTHRAVLASLANTVAVYTEKLLVHANNVPYLADALKALSCAVGNPRNAAKLAEREEPMESSLLQPILHFIIRHVEETRASYREPVLVQLLRHILKLFLQLSLARFHASQASDSASLTRQIHNHSREIGVCTVLKAFQTDRPTQEPPPPPDPTNWLALKALCLQIAVLIHCSC